MTHSHAKSQKKTNKNKQTIEEPLNTPQPNTEPNQMQIEGNRNCLLRVRRGTEMRQSRFPWAEAVFFSVIYMITPNSKRAKTNQQGFVSDVWDVEFILFYVFFNPANRKDTQKNQPRQSRRLGWWTETYPKNIWFDPHQKWIKPVAKSCHEL